jgi:hypothetical protein
MVGKLALGLLHSKIECISASGLTSWVVEQMSNGKLVKVAGVNDNWIAMDEFDISTYHGIHDLIFLQIFQFGTPNSKGSASHQRSITLSLIVLSGCLVCSLSAHLQS